MRFALWPRSLFGRLLAASVVAVLLSHAAALLLIAQEREHFMLQGSVREWTRRIADATLMLAPLSGPQRTEALAQLSAQSAHMPYTVLHHPPMERRAAYQRGHAVLRLPLHGDFESALREQLTAALGPAYGIEIAPTAEPPPPAVVLPAPFYQAHELALHPASIQRYDVKVRFADGETVIYRVMHMPWGTPLPRNLLLNLALLLLLLVIVLYLTARNITRPLSELAHAADSLGRDTRSVQPLAERGALELRDAARAFNAMQDRLHRYLDSRTRVLAAMSHDLKTPLTRLRLQVEALDNPPMQARIGRELDEMESMVREALALFRGLDDGEPAAKIDVDELLAQIRGEFTDMGATVTLSGRALRPFTGKPQALKRCLTNLIANAVKFGSRAEVSVEDGADLLIRIRDQGPGIPEEELERVFEPFYRLESSRNRDSGGTGLGLSIARDIALAHGGSLRLANAASGGLEATLRLPRRR